MLIRNAEIPGHGRADVRVSGESIEEVGRDLAPRGDEDTFDAGGGALLPGLHDHHTHLLALAASRTSLPCDPVACPDEAALARALRAAEASRGWVRGVGYHESCAGLLDRETLDALVPDRPGLRIRIQHRSGALWILNSAALAALIADDATAAPPGAERDERGRPTGRLYRADEWLRGRLGSVAPPLAPVGEHLARCGVIGVTDATPDNGPAEARIFAAAIAARELPIRLRLMGSADLPFHSGDGIERGERKIILDEPRLVPLDELAATIHESHEQARPVAIHCVTRTELALAVGALESAGTLHGDRIEHAAVASPEWARLLRERGLAVVTQPGFVHDRGDAYLRDVEPEDRAWLYRCAGFDVAGVPLGGGTDAPFGDPDPWRSMQAAVDRKTRDGAVLGLDEAVTPERALALFTSPADAPGAPPRRIAEGERADLCLLDRPWARARDVLSSDAVRATWVGGRLTYTLDE